MSTVRAVVLTLLCLVLALVLVGSLGGGVGTLGFLLLLGLAVLGFTVWWQRNRSKS